MARPSDYSPELASQICEMISNGMSVREICREDGMPDMRTVFRWLAKHEEFRQQYAYARDAQADFLSEELLEIADDGTNDWMERDGVQLVDHEHISRSKLRIDTRKWLMAKLQPKKYGDKVTNEHTGPGGGPVLTSIAVTFVKPGGE
jgi:transposase-like protein